MDEQRPRLIKRQQPHIETLQVSVQVVRIGPKQMTLAVFRQLKNEDLVALDTLELRGVPWGTVQYNPGDCPGLVIYNGHLHVVWQRGEELRRCCFPLYYADSVFNELRARLDISRRKFDLGDQWQFTLGMSHPNELREYLCRVEAYYTAKHSPHEQPALLRKSLGDFARLVEGFAAAWPGIQSRRARWQEHVEEIEALPQLFIAV